MSYYQKTMESIRFHRTTADRLQDELNADLELLFQEGLVARPADEEPTKALGKYLDKLASDNLVSAADVKSNVPATRELSHRAITAMLKGHPAVVDTETKDAFGLKVFRRIGPLVTNLIAAE